MTKEKKIFNKKIYYQEYRKNNIDKLQAYQREYYKKNRSNRKRQPKPCLVIEHKPIVIDFK
jgi:hypothetical protein